MTIATHHASEDALSLSQPIRPQLPLVSVVVVCFNQAAFIEQCLQSVLDQTYRRLQIIVIDNHSTDGSREVIERVRDRLDVDPDRTVDFIFSATNEHEMGAWIRGFGTSKGKYICFIDGDDWLLSRCVEMHVKAHLVSRVAVGFTSVDVLQNSGDQVVVANGKQMSDFIMHRTKPANFVRMRNLALFDFGPQDATGDLRADEMHLVPHDVAHEWCWSPNAGLCFRREVVELMLNPRPKLTFGADGFLVRGISCLTGGILIDRSLAVYRIHGQNVFTRNPPLKNIRQFDRERCESLDVDICDAVIECLKLQMPGLSKILESSDIYVDAVATMSRVALNGTRKGYSSYVVEFLIENRRQIEANFGSDIYRYWKNRFFKPVDRIRERIAARRA